MQRSSRDEQFELLNEYLKRVGEGDYSALESTDFDDPDIREMADGITLLAEKLSEQRAELARNRELFFGHILENMPLEIAIFDRDFRFRYVNPRGVRDPEMREWLIGKTDFDYCRKRGFSMDIAEARLNLYKKVMATGDHVEIQQDMTTREGEVVHYLRTLSPIKDENGEIEMLVGYGINVTELKQKEKLLQVQNQELEKTNQELDHFVYRASHDMRAPLVSVMGLLNLTSYEEVSDSMGEYLKMMRQSVTKLDTFIREIVDYSKNSRKEMEWEEVDLDRLLADVLQKLAYLDPDDEVDFTIHITAPAPFHTDRLRLDILLSNVISNAIKYRRPGEHRHQVNIRIQADADKAVIKVEDNGRGIDRKHLDRIFEMFFRATHDAYGSGIGLYIVQEVLQKLKGKVAVESEPGSGTLFRITLPNMTNRP